MTTEQKQTGLTFNEAMAALKNGAKIKFPEWTGYWFFADDLIKVFTRTGDILLTPVLDLHHVDRKDWMITEGNLGFDFAILALKAGKLVSRKGWNGKGMFVFLRPADQLNTDFIINNVKSLPKALNNYYEQSTPGAVDFGAYLCMLAADGSIVNGWLASQTDLLADDWGVLGY